MLSSIGFTKIKRLDKSRRRSSSTWGFLATWKDAKDVVQATFTDPSEEESFEVQAVKDSKCRDDKRQIQQIRAPNRIAFDSAWNDTDRRSNSEATKTRIVIIHDENATGEEKKKDEDAPMPDAAVGTWAGSFEFQILAETLGFRALVATNCDEIKEFNPEGEFTLKFFFDYRKAHYEFVSGGHDEEWTSRKRAFERSPQEVDPAFDASKKMRGGGPKSIAFTDFASARCTTPATSAHRTRRSSKKLALTDFASTARPAKASKHATFAHEEQDLAGFDLSCEISTADQKKNRGLTGIPSVPSFIIMWVKAWRRESSPRPARTLQPLRRITKRSVLKQRKEKERRKDTAMSSNLLWHLQNLGFRFHCEISNAWWQQERGNHVGLDAVERAKSAVEFVDTNQESTLRHFLMLAAYLDREQLEALSNALPVVLKQCPRPPDLPDAEGKLLPPSRQQQLADEAVLADFRRDKTQLAKREAMAKERFLKCQKDFLDLTPSFKFVMQHARQLFPQAHVAHWGADSKLWYQETNLIVQHLKALIDLIRALRPDKLGYDDDGDDDSLAESESDEEQAARNKVAKEREKDCQQSKLPLLGFWIFQESFYTLTQLSFCVAFSSMSCVSFSPPVCARAMSSAWWRNSTGPASGYRRPPGYGDGYGAQASLHSSSHKFVDNIRATVDLPSINMEFNVTVWKKLADDSGDVRGSGSKSNDDSDSDGDRGDGSASDYGHGPSPSPPPEQSGHHGQQQQMTSWAEWTAWVLDNDNDDKTDDDDDDDDDDGPRPAAPCLRRQKHVHDGSSEDCPGGGGSDRKKMKQNHHLHHQLHPNPNINVSVKVEAVEVPVPSSPIYIDSDRSIGIGNDSQSTIILSPLPEPEPHQVPLTGFSSDDELIGF
eukprot:symbB.v1.2.010359.t1/scaffold677.1/size173266/7